MKNRWLILLLLFSLAINIAATFTLGYHWFRSSRSKKRLIARANEMRMLHRDLNLSSEQNKCIEAQKQHLREVMLKNQRVLRKYRMQLLEYLKQSDPDTSAINELLDEMVQIQVQNEKLFVYHLLEYKKLLTDKQFESFLNKFNQFIMKRKKRFHRGMRGPGPLNPAPNPYFEVQ